MICPHCRFETLGFPCAKCGWEALRAWVWAAQEAEKSGHLEAAAGFWRAASKEAPSDPAVLRAFASALARLYLSGSPRADFDETVTALGATLQQDPAWSEGHQWRILLFGRAGRLGELEEAYAAGGKDSARWLEGVRLERRFREQGLPPVATQTTLRVWFLRGFLFLLGLGVTLAGSLWCHQAYAQGRNVFFPLFVLMFGLMLAGGSAFLYWNAPKKQKKKADEAS